jgi:hypothetical protein
VFVSLAIAADKYHTHGMYTDAAIAMLRQIRHGFGG